MECSVQARFDVQTLRKLDEKQRKCRVCTWNRRIKPCFVYKPRNKCRTREVRFLKTRTREKLFLNYPRTLSRRWRSVQPVNSDRWDTSNSNDSSGLWVVSRPFSEASKAAPNGKSTGISLEPVNSETGTTGSEGKAERVLKGAAEEESAGEWIMESEAPKRSSGRQKEATCQPL